MSIFGPGLTMAMPGIHIRQAMPKASALEFRPKARIGTSGHHKTACGVLVVGPGPNVDMSAYLLPISRMLQICALLPEIPAGRAKYPLFVTLTLSHVISRHFAA